MLVDTELASRWMLVAWLEGVSRTMLSTSWGMLSWLPQNRVVCEEVAVASAMGAACDEQASIGAGGEGVAARATSSLGKNCACLHRCAVELVTDTVLRPFVVMAICSLPVPSTVIQKHPADSGIVGRYETVPLTRSPLA